MGVQAAALLLSFFSLEVAAHSSWCSCSQIDIPGILLHSQCWHPPEHEQEGSASCFESLQALIKGSPSWAGMQEEFHASW